MNTYKKVLSAFFGTCAFLCYVSLLWSVFIDQNTNLNIPSDSAFAPDAFSFGMVGYLLAMCVAVVCLCFNAYRTASK